VIRKDEVIARANNLLVGRAAYETAVRLYPRDRIDYRRWGEDHREERAEGVMKLAQRCHGSGVDLAGIS
jgi:hypothetical protein